MGLLELLRAAPAGARIEDVTPRALQPIHAPYCDMAPSRMREWQATNRMLEVSRITNERYELIREGLLHDCNLQIRSQRVGAATIYLVTYTGALSGRSAIQVAGTKTHALAMVRTTRAGASDPRLIAELARRGLLALK